MKLNAKEAEKFAAALETSEALNVDSLQPAP